MKKIIICIISALFFINNAAWADVFGQQIQNNCTGSAACIVSDSITGESVSVSSGSHNFVIGGLLIGNDWDGGTVNISGNVSGNSAAFSGGSIMHSHSSGSHIGGGALVSNIDDGGSAANVAISGNVQNNNLNISGGNINTDGGYADGGLLAIFYNETNGNNTISGSASNNTVTVSGSPVFTNTQVIGGHIMFGEDNGDYAQNAGGGLNISGDTNDNTININGGTFNDDVYVGKLAAYNLRGNGGAYAISGNSNGNTLNVTGGTMGQIAAGEWEAHDVSGAGTFNFTGGASNNEINVSGGTMRAGVLGGGVNLFYNETSGQNITMSGNADSNTVNISGGKINSSAEPDSAIAGGYAYLIKEGGSGGTQNITSGAHNNIVNISGSTAISNVNIYGGYIHGENSVAIGGTVSGNEINISGGIITNVTKIYGGYIDGYNNVTTLAGADVTNNTVNISGGIINADIISGANNSETGLGNANGNKVNITGGNISFASCGEICGIMGGGSSSDAINNTITIGSGAMLNSNNAILAGGFGTGDAFTGNTLNLAGAGRVFYGVGGFENYNFDLSGVLADSTMLTATNGNGLSKIELTDGAIDINGSTIGLKKADGTDARPDLLGLGEKITLINSGLGFSGTLTNASQQISDGNSTYVYSWVANGNKLDLSYDSYGYNDGTGNTASANISGDDTNISIAGAPIVDSVSATGDSAINIAGTGSDNVTFKNMHIGDGATLTINAVGANYGFEALHVKGEGATFAQELHAANKNLNFYIPDTTANNASMLTVDGNADIEGATVKVGFKTNGTALHNGDRVTLIHTEGGNINGTPVNFNDNVRMSDDNSTLNYQFRLAFNNGIQGGAMLAGAGLMAGVGTSSPTDLFAIVAGVSLDDKTKVISEGRIAGLAFARQGGELAADGGIISAVKSAEGAKGFSAFTAGSLGKSKYETGSYAEVKGTSFMAGLAKEFNANTFAIFFEYGNGSYDTNNSFSGGDVKGDGNAGYTGGGLLGHFALENNNYAEASARIGQVKTDFDSADYANHAYNYDTLYYGAHIGAGHIWQVAEKITLDGYGKYLWTHQNGKDIVMSGGDKVSFDAADSHRVRIGAKAAYDEKGTFSPYAGLAYEYEFAGKADAEIAGLGVDAPSLKGSVGIGELGLKITHNYLGADLSAQGYAGQRKGISGQLKLSYKF
jgi:hypothetical protein